MLPGLPPSPLRLVHENDPERVEEVAVTPVLCCNDHEAVLRSTVEGAGISSQVMQVARRCCAGRLQRVLAPWLAERFTLLACFASRRYCHADAGILDHLIRHAALARACRAGS